MKFNPLVYTFTFVIFLNTLQLLGQENQPITDFYEYVNKEWLDNTMLAENEIVINNWGILWEKITDKSIEILSGNIAYKLDPDYQYMLDQMQNFYKSAEEEIPDNRKRVYLIQSHFPFNFGVVFSRITIPQKKEEKIKELIRYLKMAYKAKIENSEHIDIKTADFFLGILNDIEFKIGAPDISHFPEMPKLSESEYESNINLSKEFALEIHDLKPEWVSPPFETDCRYDSKMNAVKIYAGTLYDFDFTNVNNYPELFATLGRTIAHEMTHAFDRYGKKFDKKAWKQINTSLIEQFNNYAIQDSNFIDGVKTLQENLADLGGVEVSLYALKIYIKESYPDYSDDLPVDALRRYFTAYADFWKEKATSEFELKTLDKIHTPQKFRAIGPIYNQDEFYKVFDIDKQSNYYISEEKRIHIW
jgi:putative endopeptidase